jgi:hypothetical protein
MAGDPKGAKMPPRRTDIRGQDHMLSYITPGEANILKSLGGSGEPGPMGIPAFDPGMGEGQDNTGIADAAGYGMTGSNGSSDGGFQEGGDAGEIAAKLAAENAKRQAELAAARKRRAEALGIKQNALTDAFGLFNDDFYGDLETSFSDFQNPLLTQSYDASLRGIFDGFKAKGMLTQSEVDAALSGLNTSKAAEMERISQGASEYTQSKRDEIAKKQSSLGDQLAAMVGGATTAADVDAQTAAIEAFDFSKDIEKLKTPSSKSGLNFFQNYNQIAATADPSVNVAAQSISGNPQTGSITPVNKTGVASPFGSNSVRVV